MVELKLDQDGRSIELIDDAESTPGASRQFTAFNEYVMPMLRKELLNKKIDEAMTFILGESVFPAGDMKFRCTKVTPYREGYTIFEYDLV